MTRKLILSLFLLAVSFGAWAQSLTAAQLQTLKAAIAAETNPTFVTYRTNGQTDLMAAWYNGASTADAWRPDMPAQALDEASDITAFDSVSAGKRDAWALFLTYAPRDMGKNKNRKVITDVWGSATAGSVAESILLASVRKATRAEVVFGFSSATTGTVTAGKLNWTGLLSGADISAALAS